MESSFAQNFPTRERREIVYPLLAVIRFSINGFMSGSATTFSGTVALSFVIPSSRLACGKLRVK
jgi:hypothetical protein